jgi:hypothetical protein
MGLGKTVGIYGGIYIRKEGERSVLLLHFGIKWGGVVGGEILMKGTHAFPYLIFPPPPT